MKITLKLWWEPNEEEISKGIKVMTAYLNYNMPADIVNRIANNDERLMRNITAVACNELKLRSNILPCFQFMSEPDKHGISELMVKNN